MKKTWRTIVELQALRIAEYIVDAILLVLIGIELFSGKKDNDKS